MNEYGEKILDVRLRPFSFVHAFFSCVFIFGICVLLCAMHFGGDVDNVEYSVGWLLSLGLLWTLCYGYLFADRKTAVISVYENGVFSNKFPLSSISFIPWQDIEEVKVNGAFVAFVPYDAQMYSKRVRLSYRLDAFLFGCPVLLKFSHKGIEFYDVDTASFVMICNDAKSVWDKRYS